MMKRSLTFSAIKLIGLTLLALGTMAVNGCDGFWLKSLELPARAGQQITVLALNTPFSSFISSSNQQNTTKARMPLRQGLERELLERWAKDAGIQIRWKIYPNETAIFQALKNGEGQIAAGRFHWPIPEEGLLQGPVYDEAELGLYCQRKLRIENAKDLDGKLVLLSKWDIENGLGVDMRTWAPGVQLEMTHEKMGLLFERVAWRKADCLVADKDNGDYFNLLHSSTDFVTSLPGKKSVSFVASSNSADLMNSIQSWIQWSSHTDTLMKLDEKYRGYLNAISYSDKVHLSKAMKEKLPSLMAYFKEAEKVSGLPWAFIAAVAFQESHWNEDARSFTGVRGVMQLTEETAAHLGVTDREDPKQSIIGGARYLAQLRGDLREVTNSLDRMSLTLVSYNLGYGHLVDLQDLLRQQGKDPNSWLHIKRVLPSKEDSSASDFKFGSARGREAIQFTERVLAFYEILSASR